MKTNSNFRDWKDLLLVVLQRIAIDPTLFNAYNRDLFFSREFIKVCKYADGTSLRAHGSNMKTLVIRLSKRLFDRLVKRISSNDRLF